MKRQKKPKSKRGRAPRPVRRLGTEIHHDKRMSRLQARADSERHAIEAELEDLDEDLLGDPYE